jgi:hypothetical protein
MRCRDDNHLSVLGAGDAITDRHPLVISMLESGQINAKERGGEESSLEASMSMPGGLLDPCRVWDGQNTANCQLLDRAAAME